MTHLSVSDRPGGLPALSGGAHVSVRGAMLTVLALALITVMFCFGQTRASAHDVLVDQTPQPGEVLDAAPDAITLSFNNNLLDMGPGASVITVSDATGTELDLGDPVISGRDATLPLGDLTEGAYHVVWSVVSSDGHRIANQFVFGIGAASADAVAELEASILAGDSDAASTDSTGAGQNDEQGDAEVRDGDETGEKALSAGAIVGISVAAAAAAALAGVMIWRKGQSSR